MPRKRKEPAPESEPPQEANLPVVVTPRRGPRPLLDPDREARILQAIANGLSYQDAAVVADVSLRALYNWLATGRRLESDGVRANDNIYVHLLQSLKSADVEGQEARLKVVLEAMEGGAILSERITARRLKDGTEVVQTERTYSRPEWTAAAWWLERHNNEKWGRRDRIDLHAMVREEVDRLATELGLDPEELMRRTEELLGKG